MATSNNQLPPPHRVVIVGGGFAGLNAAKTLAAGARPGAAVDVTLIDRRNFHLFQPLLYQVATGGLSAVDIAYPLRLVFRGEQHIETLLGAVEQIDVARRTVLVDGREAAYGTLIVATGSTHHYFGHDEWAKIAPGLKTLEDAQEIRRRILSAFEHAEREPDPARREAWLTFAIVGGGPTGVELAGALGEIARDTLRDEYRHIRPDEARIFLIEASPRVLGVDPEHASLTRLGVLPLTSARVVAIDEYGVEIETALEHRRIEARTVIWAAGVQGSALGATLAEQTGAPRDRSGRLTVEPGLTLPGHPEIFVLGDLAGATTAGAAPLPALAPVAMQQGRYAGRAILARLRGETATRPFHYVDRGSMATIGRAAAVASIRGIDLSGFLAWAAWLFIHLMYLVGFQNRLLVFIEWAFQYTSFNRRARLITHEPELAGQADKPSVRAAGTN